MDWITVVASSTGAAVVSGASALYFRSVDYDYEFKKYVLKRRIEAYEKAEWLFNLSNDVYFENDSKNKQVAVARFFYSYKEKEPPITFDDYVIQTKKIMDYFTWFTDDFKDLLIGLNNIMAQIQTELFASEERGNKLLELGIEYNTKIVKQQKLLHKQFFKDMERLDEIKEFISKKKDFAF
jgi:hypothetical protein